MDGDLADAGRDETHDGAGAQDSIDSSMSPDTTPFDAVDSSAADVPQRSDAADGAFADMPQAVDAIDGASFDVAHPSDAIDSSPADVPQTSDAADASADAAPPFSPASVAGLALWLDATNSASVSITGGKVLLWKDLSGKGNDVEQPSAANRPDYLPAGLNGLAAIGFGAGTPGQTYLQRLGNTQTSSLFIGDKDATLLVVARHHTPAASEAMLVTLGSIGEYYCERSQFGLRVNVMTELESCDDSSLGVRAIDTSPGPCSGLPCGSNAESAGAFDNDIARVYGMRRRIRVGDAGYLEATLELRVDGALVDTSYTSSCYGLRAAKIPFEVLIGAGEDGRGYPCSYAVGEFVSGAISEVVLFGGPVSDADVAGIEAYLKQKYRI